MKTDPRYGYYARWPEDGDAWVHPEDVSLARTLIPSDRIWRRDDLDGPFMQLTYGDICLRVQPTLWVEVDSEGLEIGDWVEVKSRVGKNTYQIAKLCEMLWDEHARRIRYRVEGRGQVVPIDFEREDLRPVEPLES